jgi:hypothetical protein
MITRRSFVGSLAAASLLTGASCGMPASDRGPSTPDPATGAALLDDLERRVFRFFWDTTDPQTGLAPDRWPTPSFCSIAAVGFALTAYPIGVERGWISRAQARSRVLATLRFFRDAPQGPEPGGRSGYRGFFYHFLDMRTGARFGQTELSTVDTALLLAGTLFCQSWFDGADAEETQIRAAADEIYARVDWRWAQPRPPRIAHGWHPETGFIASDWTGYDEAMIVYLLALGSPTFAVAPDAWEAWCSTYDARSWGTEYGYTFLRFAPLFGHQFSHCWVDFRGILDSYMRARGFDYFENSRRAAYAQRAYAIANPMRWKGYGGDVWGISACDGPTDATLPYLGELRAFRSYAGRGAGGAHTYDDGTLAPYAAGASVAFAPEIAIPALAAMRERYGAHIYSTYGFLDAFNPSFEYDVPLKHGRIVPGFGWVDTDYLGIDQGPLLAMLGNYRGEIVWRAMRGNAHLLRGLRRAGFAGGWLG